jgi:hypothetical protein
VVTAGVFGWNLMLFVLCVEIARKAHDRPQADAVAQRAAVPRSNPRKSRPGTHMRVAVVGGERSEVTEDLLGIFELETDSPTSSEVGIDSCGQHGVTSGQGWATCVRRC